MKSLCAELAVESPPADALEEALAADPRNWESRYRLAARRIANAEHEAGLEQLIVIPRIDRHFRDDAGRRGLLCVFSMLGDDPLVGRYRSRMSSLLY